MREQRGPRRTFLSKGQRSTIASRARAGGGTTAATNLLDVGGRRRKVVHAGNEREIKLPQFSDWLIF